MYGVLNTLSEYTYLYISKNITSYTFLLVFKIVESLQCILKLIKLSANVVDKYLTSIINLDILQSYFSDGAKNALVRPIDNNKDKQNMENYRPVSILNGFSKFYEGFINDSMLPIVQTFLSNFISAYRKHCSANPVLISLIENWKKNLENNEIVGAVSLDLSKAFNCIPHDLLIAKMEPSGFSENFLTFLYSYLKRRKQFTNIKMSTVCSKFYSPVSCKGPF